MADHTGQGRHCSGGFGGGELALQRGRGRPEHREHDEGRDMDRVEGSRQVSGLIGEGCPAAAPGHAGLEAELVAGEDVGGRTQDVPRRGQAAARSSGAWMVTS